MMWMSCISVCFFRWRRTRNEKNSIALSSELAHTKANQYNRCDDLKRIKLMTVKQCVLYYENFVNKSRQRQRQSE